MDKLKTKKEIIKFEGKLKEILTVHDSKGKILHKIISPLRVQFLFKDLLQVIIGASILAIPVGFTEETWRLGELLPTTNILILMGLSLVFISGFVYYYYYQKKLKEHYFEFIKRVLATYIASFIIVAVLLTTIQMAPWSTDLILAVKRAIIVSFPASMSAAVADTLH